MSVYIAVALQRKVRKQFGNCCAYCRTAESLTVVTFEVEHIIPRSGGGDTQLGNLALACPTCNRLKAARTAFPDPASQQLVPLFHPQRDAWTAHFAWNEDQSHIIASTAVGRATLAALKMNRSALIRLRRLWVAIGEHPPHME